LLAIIFFGSQIIGDKPLLQRVAHSAIELPDKIWRQLNISWAIFFLVLGLTNVYVIYNFTTNVWVHFKLFGTLGLTICFIVLQAIYMAKHSQMQNGNS